ncbi:zinc-ribbon domain-containing protein [Nocardioides panacihumi]|uniref:zinc-ribbon domain-containing protein n=1 Tax=Nocardioides panacihumi TaxID=400774 RepID=UPI0031D4433B
MNKNQDPDRRHADAMSTPFTPENIYGSADGRWYHDGRDVSDHLVWWQCTVGHSWQASLIVRTSSDDPGCPTCWADGLGDLFKGQTKL